MPQNLVAGWTRPSTISKDSYRFMWDEDNLYILEERFDEIYSPKADNAYSNCWSGGDQTNFNILLPAPITEYGDVTSHHIMVATPAELLVTKVVDGLEVKVPAPVGTIAESHSERAVHEWDDGTVTTPSTHLTIGIKTYVCTDCGASKYETLPKLTEHTFGDWTKTDDQTHLHTCECGLNETASHVWDNGKVTTAPTHTTVGVMTYTCLDCGATAIEEIAKTAEHTYGEWTKIDLIQHKKNCECGDVQYGCHIWDEGKSVASDTSDSTAEVKVYTCTECGATKTGTDDPTAAVVSGCQASLSGGALLMLLMMGTAGVVSLKKKKH